MSGEAPLRWPRRGDIILLNYRKDSSKDSKKNRLGQWILARRRPRYTHVGLCMGLGQYLHAEPPNVDFIYGEDLFAQYDDWRAIRHSVMGEMERTNYAKIVSAAIYYLRMKYVDTWWNVLSNQPLKNETICSVLIRNVYRDLGVAIAPDVENPLPAHFQSLLEDDPANWRDVTDEHKLGLDVLRQKPDLKERTLRWIDMQRQQQKWTLEGLELHKLAKEMLRVFKESDAKWGLPTNQYPELVEPDYPHDYWNAPKIKAEGKQESK
jgi:hypothetical protein